MLDMHVAEAPAIGDMLAENAIVGAPKSGGKRFWTTTENATLRRIYPAEGLRGCVTALPGRSASSIYQRALVLRLRAPAGPGRSKTGVPRQKWTSSPQIDAIIRLRYPACTERNAVLALARSLHRPRWWVSKRAARLGLVMPRLKAPDWTPAELQLVETHAAKAPESIARILRKAGHQRSATAVIVKLKRLGTDRTDPHHYTARGLAGCFNVDSTTIEGWITRGLLKGGRRGTARTEQQGGDQWWIHRRDVRAFVIAHVQAVDFRKADKFWLVDLLTNREAGEHG